MTLAIARPEFFPSAKAHVAVTGKEEYLQKALQYLKGIPDAKNGYLATEKSCFVFIENRSEYKRGDFKVRRAQSGGWVQEAEFFSKVSMAYDMLYEHFTQEQRMQMEECLRNYRQFSSRRLTGGDGNNFQLAESAAGALCAMVLQEQGLLERFLYGFNGYTELLSAVLLDDGMYFEEASGYVKLAGECSAAPVSCLHGEGFRNRGGERKLSGDGRDQNTRGIQ